MGIIVAVIAFIIIGYIVSHLFGRNNPVTQFFRVLFTLFRKLWGIALLLVIVAIALAFFGII